MSGPRILTVDLETMPAEVVTFSTYKPIIGISQIMRPVEVASVAWKWRGAERVYAASAHFDGTQAMAEAIWKAVDECDFLITWNGDQFDIPKLKSLFLFAGLRPPSPFKSIDLIKTARKALDFQSNRLAYVAHVLGVGEKMETGGLELWLECLEGKPAAWRKLIAYNKQDVRVTEGCYDKLLPWMRTHPHVGLWSDKTGHICPRCGSENVQRRGSQVALAMTYQRFACQDCGSWSRSAKGEAMSSDLRSVQ